MTGHYLVIDSDNGPHVAIPQALLAMIMLPSNEPEELGGPNIPLAVQDYVKAVSVCFGSQSRISDMPSVLPAPLQRAEVAVMIEQLEITLHHTSLLLLLNEQEAVPKSAEGEAHICRMKASLKRGQPPLQYGCT